MVNTTRKPLTVYKASAGSGKTFTLATEYIRLLIENPQSYRNILAVTFTNKATEEMKTRILSQLYGIWKQLPESDRYLKAIEEKTHLSPNIIRERSGLGLANLLHNYSYFRVETIDTFFQSVLRTMARELELTTNLRIGLNDEQIEELAVDQMIEDLNATDVVLQWILKYIMENISDDKSWNIISQIKKFGRTIFKDKYKEVSQTLERKMAEPGFFEEYTTQLREIRTRSEEHMKEYAKSFFDVIESEGLTIDDFAYGKTGICSFFLKLQQGVFDESVVGKRITDCLGDSTKWCKKSHPRRELIYTLADSTLGDILRYAIEERPRQWCLNKSADLTLRHLNQLRLLSSIEHKVRELNETNNRFLLSDTQQLLHSLIGESDSPFIFEKIGTQLEHVMIDEFQDTSTVQWKNFKVLLSEILSHEQGSSLIVGDVKQSIYRWRSGDWRLLNDIECQFNDEQIETLPLKTNYRSERNIIEFNNTFFRHAAELEYLTQKEFYEEGAEQLQKGYADVEQLVPEGRLSQGEIFIRLLPPEDYQEKTLQQIADTISYLLSHGARQQEMAILVRMNSNIPLIAQYFMKQMPEVTIVSDEAFRLDASPAVNLLIHALRLLTHPNDQLAKATIVKIWQCDVLQKNIVKDSTRIQEENELLLSTIDINTLLPDSFRDHQEELLILPLYELVERLYAIFELERLNSQSAYVCAFFDYLSTFISENTASIDDFLTEWEETLCGKTIQSDETDGVRIISIHKSKGLEYNYVICPFCDWPLERGGDILWCQPQKEPFNQLPIAPIDYSQKQMMGTIYEGDYLYEHLQNAVDNLNLLYVAFTRACKGLYVIGRRKTSNSRSALIEQCIPLVANEMPSAAIEGLDDEQQPITFTYGVVPDTIDKKANTNESVTTNPFLKPSTPLTVDYHYQESKVTFRQSNRSRDFMSGEDKDEEQRQHYIQIGSVLHQIFSTIRTADDIDDALSRLQFEGVLYDEHITAEHITNMLRKRLSHPKVADWFSSRWTLFNECTILFADHTGQVVERRPDRVMTDGNEWIVVDFKFGTPQPEYHDQVREYMQLLSTMGHQNVTGYLWYIYSNQIEEVR